MDYSTILEKIKELTDSQQLIGNPAALGETIIYSKITKKIQENWDTIIAFIQNEFPNSVPVVYDKIVTFSDNFISFHISPIYKMDDMYLFRVIVVENISGSVVSKVVGSLERPTAEMVDWYIKRTKEHINRVKENLLRIGDWFDFDTKELKERADSHDLSKYSTEEKEPYIWLSWYYKKEKEGDKFKYPPKIKETIDKATLHHISVNPHHPEAHSSSKEMTNLDIAEMIADHAAMSQELGSSLVEWTRNNTIKKYEWKSSQKKLIWELVGIFSELR